MSLIAVPKFIVYVVWGISVSSSVSTSVFPFTRLLTSWRSGGDTTSCELRSLTWMYSSNVMLISGPLKCVVKFSGDERVISGGLESFSPPDGGTWLAQENSVNV